MLPLPVRQPLSYLCWCYIPIILTLSAGLPPPQAKAQVLPWLDGLLADSRGRKLIYELSAAHRNSLLLNFAIQKIMKQVGTLSESHGRLVQQLWARGRRRI